MKKLDPILWGEFFKVIILINVSLGDDFGLVLFDPIGVHLSLG